MPPWAPFTIASWGFFAGSAFAAGMKALNSRFVFDIPIEKRTIFPAGSGTPFPLNGSMLAAAARPADSKLAGRVFEPPGYRPPWKPRYVPLPNSVSGMLPVEVLAQFDASPLEG